MFLLETLCFLRDQDICGEAHVCSSWLRVRFYGRCRTGEHDQFVHAVRKIKSIASHFAVTCRVEYLRFAQSNNADECSQFGQFRDQRNVVCRALHLCWLVVWPFRCIRNGYVVRDITSSATRNCCFGQSVCLPQASFSYGRIGTVHKSSVHCNCNSQTAIFDQQFACSQASHFGLYVHVCVTCVVSFGDYRYGR